MNILKITRIDITNYRSCLKTVLEPTKTLSVLIGANGTGKSNILNAILLLQKVNLIRFESRDSFLADRCKITVTFQYKNKKIKRQSIIRFSTDDRNRDEVISFEEKWNLSSLTKINKWFNIPFELIHQRYDHFYSDQYFNFFLKNQIPKELKLNSTVLKTIREISQFSQKISYYSASRFTDPSKCPSSFEIDDENSLRRHYNQYDHLQFIYDLYVSHKSNTRGYQEFISIVGSDGIRLIDSIKFKEISAPSKVLEVKAGGKVVKKNRKTLLVIPHFTIKKTKLSPNQLSEGTFKTLALLFYIITDKSKILLIEEPEVCIHHGLLATIMELIRVHSTKKQIIISTHSDFVLDKTDPEQVFLVDNRENGTVVKHIPNTLSIDNYEALIDYLDNSGNLGEYWKHGGFET